MCARAFNSKLCPFKNVALSRRYAKAVEAQGGDSSLVASAKKEIAQSFAEFWLFKIETELNAVHVHAGSLASLCLTTEVTF